MDFNPCQVNLKRYISHRLEQCRMQYPLPRPAMVALGLINQEHMDRCRNSQDLTVNLLSR